MKGGNRTGRKCVYRVLTEALLAELPLGILPEGPKRRTETAILEIDQVRL